MTRTRIAAALTLALSVSAGASLLADVRTEDKSLVRFEGGLGKVINFFAGKAAKEGVKTTVALKGDRKAEFRENDGTIVDLNEEKVYELNMKKKTYTVVTFAEIRRRMEEARKKAEEEQRKAEAEEKKDQKPEAKDEKQVQMEVDFDVKETGQKKAINGFDTRQVIMTITMREKGKTLEQSGGLVLTSDMWMTPSISAMKELIDFEIRYAKQLNGPETFGASVEQMQAALAAHPQLKQGLARMAEESKKMDGTAILTTTTMEAVKSAEQLAAEQKAAADNRSDDKSSTPTSVGGLLGGFGKKLAKKNDKDKEEAGPKTRAAFMTITNERLSVSTTVAANDVAVPAGFKEEK